MTETAPTLKVLMIAAGLFIQVCLTPWTWADNSASPVTLAVLEFSLNLDIANLDDAAYDRLPAPIGQPKPAPLGFQQ